MSFFHGASNVKISGGSFNVVQGTVHGNVGHFDGTRHLTNVDSFNTTTRTMVGSGNNYARRYYGNSGYYIEGDDQPRSAPPGRPAAGPYPNDRNGYFPQPPRGPQRALGPAPPGSRSVDSYNHESTQIENSFNDHSRVYGAPPSRDQRESQPNLESFWDDDDGYERQRGQKGQSPESSRDYYRPQYGPGSYGPNGRPSYYDQRRGFTPNTPMRRDYSMMPGVQTMTKEMQVNFKKLMETVEKETAPDAEDETMEDEEESGSDEDEIKEPEPKRQTGDITSGVAGLSLSDTASMADIARAAVSSGTKSAPPLGAAQAASSWSTQPQGQSTPFLGVPPVPGQTALPVPGATTDAPGTSSGMPPMNGVDPTNGANYYGAAGWPPGGAQQYYPQPPHPSDPNGHWGAPPESYYGYGGPNAYNSYHGAHGVENIRSGNTSNIVLKDSYNDHSITEYEPADEPPSPSRTRKRRGSRDTAQ